MTVNKQVAFLLGVLVGALVVWIYVHRDTLLFAAKNQGKFGAAEKIIDGVKGVFG